MLSYRTNYGFCLSVRRVGLQIHYDLANSDVITLYIRYPLIQDDLFSLLGDLIEDLLYWVTAQLLAYRWFIND